MQNQITRHRSFGDSNGMLTEMLLSGTSKRVSQVGFDDIGKLPESRCPNVCVFRVRGGRMLCPCLHCSKTWLVRGRIETAPRYWCLGYYPTPLGGRRKGCDSDKRYSPVAPAVKQQDCGCWTSEVPRGGINGVSNDWHTIQYRALSEQRVISSSFDGGQADKVRLLEHGLTLFLGFLSSLPLLIALRRKVIKPSSFCPQGTLKAICTPQAGHGNFEKAQLKFMCQLHLKSYVSGEKREFWEQESQKTLRTLSQNSGGLCKGREKVDRSLSFLSAAFPHPLWGSLATLYFPPDQTHTCV